MNKIIRKDHLVHRLFTIAYLVSAVLTMIPNEAASRECLLGYKALCSFTPFGTIILTAMAIIHVAVMMARSRKRNKAN